MKNEKGTIVLAGGVIGLIAAILVSSVSSLLNGGDVVSVRGFGRFVFVKEIKETKKGRLVLEIKKY